MKMTIAEFVVLALATWRLSSMISAENGPGDIFETLRFKLGVRWNEDLGEYPSTALAEQITCIWCLSVWVGIILGFFWVILPRTTVALSAPFALSAAAAWIHSRGVRFRKAVM